MVTSCLKKRKSEFPLDDHMNKFFSVKAGSADGREILRQNGLTSISRYFLLAFHNVVIYHHL
jgi:hypothetical protein